MPTLRTKPPRKVRKRCPACFRAVIAPDKCATCNLLAHGGRHYQRSKKKKCTSRTPRKYADPIPEKTFDSVEKQLCSLVHSSPQLLEGQVRRQQRCCSPL